MAFHGRRANVRVLLLISMFAVSNALRLFPPDSAPAPAPTATPTIIIDENGDQKLSVDHSIEYLFQFGDSISDTGNLVIENPVIGRPYHNFPYGESIHRATGRCSDGLLMIDRFATFFHKDYLNPYLDKGADFSQGVNFAVAGSTALDTDVLQSKGILSPVTPSSLSVQLDWFLDHLQSMCDTEDECREKVKKSLVLIETGGNDYNYALLQNKTVSQVRPMVPEVVRAITKAVHQVVSLGATKVYIPGNFPIGCLPIYKSTFGDFDSLDELDCLAGLNGFARYHNEYLQRAIGQLQQQYPEVAIVYGDYYSALSSIIENAGRLGFDPSAFGACCGYGGGEYNFDLAHLCGSPDAEVCVGPNQSISWDGIHMTQHAYKLMSQPLLRKLYQELNKFEVISSQV